MTTESDIIAWLDGQQDAMIALLKAMVDIDSGSYNKPGIDAVGAVVRDAPPPPSGDDEEEE